MRSIYQAEAWNERPIERELLEALEFVANVARSMSGFSPMALRQADAAIAKAQVQP